MTIKTWTLTDVDAGEHCEALEVDRSELGDGFKTSPLRKWTVRGGAGDGVDVVSVDNGRLRFDVLPTRGMSLWKAWLGDLEFGWKSPVQGPVHPAFVPIAEPSGLGWLDGFDELLVRCGLESNGAPEFDEEGRVAYPLHGRIGNLPARKVTASIDTDSGEISVTGVVDEIRFHFLKLRLHSTVKTRLGESRLEIHDVVENLSASPAESQLLYHVNFGVPLLDGGSQIVAPAKTVVPRNQRAADGVKNWASYEAEQPGFEEQVYFLDLLSDPQGKTRALLKDSHGTRGASLRFSVEQLPCFTVWKNTTAIEDGYVTGIEPATNYPNPRSFEGEQGRVAKLPPKGKQSFQLGIDFHATAAEVASSEAAIAKLSAGKEPVVHNQPQAGWCEGV